MASGWHRKKDDPASRARAAEYRSPEYRAARAAAKRQVDAGYGQCWRCGAAIPPGAPFHLGHDDTDRRIIRGVEDPSCNLRAAATKGARIANARRKARATGTTALRM